MWGEEKNRFLKIVDSHSSLRKQVRAKKITMDYV